MRKINTNLWVRPAQFRDAFSIELCAQDLAEREALNGAYGLDLYTPNSLADTIREHADTTIAFVDGQGRIVALAGCTVLAKSMISPWMIFSALAGEHKFSLLKACIQMRDQIGKDHPLFGRVHWSSNEAIEFLQRLGAEFHCFPGSEVWQFVIPARCDV